MKNKYTDYKRSFNEAKYDRLAITVPKGQKAAIQAAAETVGETVNSYTNKALLARMGLTDWPEVSADEG